jgi:TRAP transporter TAXI family solute receptor
MIARSKESGITKQNLDPYEKDVVKKQNLNSHKEDVVKRQGFVNWCIFCSFLVIVSIFLLSVVCPPLSAQTAPVYPKVLRMGVLSPGSTIYAVGSGLAKVGSDHSPMTVMVVPNSTTNAFPNMLADGRADLTLDTVQVQWQMYTGKIAPADPIPKGFSPKPPFPGDKNLRFLMVGPPNMVGMLVRKDSGMRDVADVKGKTIGDFSTFPSLVSLTLAILYNGGLTLDDVRTNPVTEVVAGVKAVQEKRINATTCAVGMGAVAEADNLVGVRFLRSSMDPERVKAGQRCTPGAYATIVKAGTGAGVVEDTPIWGVPFAIMVSTRMADHVAYKLVETWWTYYKEYATVHTALKEWTPDKFVSKDTVVPYHNGAIGFYKDKGVWTPEMEKIQNQVLKGQ